MKFEVTYAQEIKVPYWRNETARNYAPSLLEAEAANRHFTSRKRNTWNCAVFRSSGIGPDFTGVCTSFTLASRVLYTGELCKYARRLSAFSGKVAWPNLETVDPHYFTQILGGVVRSCFRDVEGLVLLNKEEFWKGLEYPIFNMVLTPYDLDIHGYPWKWGEAELR